LIFCLGNFSFYQPSQSFYSFTAAPKSPYTNLCGFWVGLLQGSLRYRAMHLPCKQPFTSLLHWLTHQQTTVLQTLVCFARLSAMPLLSKRHFIVNFLSRFLFAAYLCLLLEQRYSTSVAPEKVCAPFLYARKFWKNNLHPSGRIFYSKNLVVRCPFLFCCSSKGKRWILPVWF
jgi:hypothetical protein